MTRNNAPSDNLNDVYRTLQRLQPSAQFLQDIDSALFISFTDELPSGRRRFLSPGTFISHRALYYFSNSIVIVTYSQTEMKLNE